MQGGLPEFLVVLTIGAFWLIPVAAGVWALVTLRRLRSGQEEVLREARHHRATGSAGHDTMGTHDPPAAGES